MMDRLLSRLVLGGIAGVIALVLLLGVLGVVFSLALSMAGFLLLRIAPVLIVGYLVVRFVARRHPRLIGRARRWLEGR